MSEFLSILVDFDNNIIGLGSDYTNALNDAYENEYTGDLADLNNFDISKAAYEIIENNYINYLEEVPYFNYYATLKAEEFTFYLFEGKYLVTGPETEKCFSKKNSFSIHDYDDFTFYLNNYDDKNLFWFFNCPDFNEENLYSAEELLNLVRKQDINYWLHEGNIIYLNSYVESRKIKNI